MRSDGYGRPVLEDDEHNRDQYASLEQFIPLIVDFFDEYAARWPDDGDR